MTAHGATMPEAAEEALRRFGVALGQAYEAVALEVVTIEEADRRLGLRS